MFRFTLASEVKLSYGKAKHYKNQLGTNWVHVENSISNNVFNIGFTTPGHSSGITHILEHTTLCGSSKYPIRDPFFKMLNRSMATFMNAMTADDHTMYPFSSQNELDYFNLMVLFLIYPRMYISIRFFTLCFQKMTFYKRDGDWLLKATMINPLSSRALFLMK